MTFFGIGLSPVGSGIVGYGLPDATNDITNTDLIIESGEHKGQVGDCRLIDPITKDYKYNSNGLMVGGISTQQQVYLALLTVKGSSVVPSLGQKFSNTKIIGKNYQSNIISEVNNALASLVKNNKITIQDVNVSRQNTRILIDVRWFDLSRQTNETTSI